MSSVVKLSVDEDIATVVMKDHDGRNMFTPALIDGLLETFESIRSHPTAKVVVVHGYDSYFCSGGTKEELLGILDGTVKFDDVPFYDLPLQCDLPVISAMQGHALGGGLVFGAYGDLLVLAEECLYGAVFMKYGFTPGMGGTYIIPEKFGVVLGTEMLFTARNYYGHELRSRGVSARVVKKSEVIPAAMNLARDLASKPRLALVELKRELARSSREVLLSVIERELEMHRKTFAQPEVRERIEELFGR